MSVSNLFNSFAQGAIFFIPVALVSGCTARQASSTGIPDAHYAQRDGDNRDMASYSLRPVEYFQFKPIENMPGVPVQIQEFAVKGLQAKQSLAALLADAKKQNLDASQVARSWFLIKMHIAMNGVNRKDIKEEYIALVKSEDYKLFKQSDIYGGLTSSEESDFNSAINIIEAIANGDVEIVPKSEFDQKRDEFLRKLQTPLSKEAPGEAPPPAEYAGNKPKRVV